MNRIEILGKLNVIFCDIFSRPELVITDETSSDNLYGWDSLMHVLLIAEIEYAFKIRVPLDKINSLKNVNEMINTIIENTK